VVEFSTSSVVRSVPPVLLGGVLILAGMSFREAFLFFLSLWPVLGFAVFWRVRFIRRDLERGCAEIISGAVNAISPASRGQEFYKISVGEQTFEAGLGVHLDIAISPSSVRVGDEVTMGYLPNSLIIVSMQRERRHGIGKRQRRYGRCTPYGSTRETKLLYSVVNRLESIQWALHHHARVAPACLTRRWNRHAAR
jgi:hypothetical protein